MLPEDTQVVQYLMNFWEHSLHDTLIDKGGKVQKIRKICNSNPEQIQVIKSKNWYFIQDFMWNPSLEEATNMVCKKLEIRINADGTLFKNGVFRSKPETFQELYSTITEFRVESI
jgi:lipopolysaccharide biosynthesis protein